MSERSKNHDPEKMLGELIELSMGLARRAAARVKKAETPDEMESAVRDFERLTQDVCESIALRREFEADRVASQRDLERKYEDLMIEANDGPRIVH